MNRLRTTLWTIAAAAGVAGLLAVPPAAADFVINDDLIVTGSACVGFDCVNGESFGFDTIKLKEHNLRIKFDDTSTAAGFPTNEWQLTINDSNSGGANKFSIEDIGNARIPFTILAGAPSNSLFVNASGRVGLRTATPVVELHIKDGDTPTLRLEQDGSSGFPQQIWDVAGNETNFFIRDVSNGSTLPFRIRPGAPTSSIDVSAAGNVGIGTTAPTSRLHVLRSDQTAKIRVEETNAAVTGRVLMELVNTGPTRLQFNNSSAGNLWNFAVDGGTSFNIDKPGNVGIELSLDDAGNLTIKGQCAEGAQPGTCADYVFEPGYEYLSLKELESFIRENKHLPNVPSTEQIRRDGVNVQHFQGRLLEKIEELVLYTLEQQRTIDGQQEVIDALHGRIEALEGRIATP